MKKIIRIALIVLCVAVASAELTHIAAAERIESVESDASARAVSGGIEVKATEETKFEIYSITGQQVKTLTVSGEPQTIELPNGCYIVRCPQWSKKVVVR